jgi:methylenetetrahydrofolate--tRNA-(uracil-5-)-methyltransferase
MGLITGIFIAQILKNPTKKITRPNNKTAIGSLLNHIAPDEMQRKISNENIFQPMNVNFGLFEPLVKTDLLNKKTSDRKDEYSKIAISELNKWFGNIE